MRKAIFILGFLFILSACSADLLDSNLLSYDNQNDREEDTFQNCRVASVIDGDTIKCEINGRIESVRLLLIDTPETKAPNKPVQPFGIEASEYAKNTLQDKNVVLEFDGPVRDKYDRLLAYIWVDDHLFNAMIVEQGLARVAYVYDPPYEHYDAIVQAESRAKALKTGIWSIDGYVTEDGYQDLVASNTSETDEIYYKNCQDVRAAGAAPLHIGQPGYGQHLDKDGDGVACE